ncbi:MAG TPA: PspC domain-containing protein, partial [Acidimicrobiia bacterium]
MDTTMTEDPPPPPPPPSQPSPPLRPGRRLTRSRDDRVLGGIAGGIAHTYSWDPGLVRVIIAVAAVVTGGAVAVAYGIAWLVVPEETTGITGVETFQGRRLRHARENWALPVGVILVAAGMLGVAHRFAWGPFSQLFWPITLIGGGLAVLLVRHRDPALTDDGAGTGTGDTTTPSARDRHDAQMGVPPAMSAAATATASESSATAAAPTFAATTAEQPTVRAYESHGPWPTGEPVIDTPPPPRRERSMLGRLTWSALLLLAGAAALLNATGAVDVDAGFVLTLALVLVGVALLVGAWLGRSRGLIALALLLVLACSVDAALD